jgi:ABC-type Zn uptake system ZnuABC Zn-binding protein ZnuA
MKKICKIIFLTILTISIFSIKVSADDLNIVCTNSVLADFTSNLIDENVSIEYLMPSGVCPAFYDCPPSDVSKVVSADIIISFGNTKIEPWLADLLIHNEDVILIECKDLGEWNLPSNAKKYVDCLKDELINYSVGANETIIENSENYILKINEKSDELIEKIENNNLTDTKIISMAWHKDFLEWIGFDVVYSFGPPQSISTQDELDIINAANDNEVYAVVDNLQSGTDFGAEVSSKSGASHVIFTNFPGAIPGTDTYLEMIEYNTDKLIEAIETYEYKKGDISGLEQDIKNLEFQRNIFAALIVIFIIVILIMYVFYKRK